MGRSSATNDRQGHCLKGGRRLQDLAEPEMHNNCTGWYRKHFSLPAKWQTDGGVTWVYFEGVYHDSMMWLNGQRLGGEHVQGYTSFWHRLDDSGALFGPGSRNVLAVFANAYPGTGYWYGGGGLYRHQYLVHTTSAAFLPPDRSWVHANLTTAKLSPNGALPAQGSSATGVEVVSEVEVRNGHATKPLANVWVTTEIFPDVTSASAGPFTLAPGDSRRVRLSLSPSKAVQLWSVARPFLHVALVSVRVGGATGQVVDAFNVSYGVRDIWLDPDQGMFINGQHVKMRGYCDHSNFGGVGSAVPDRVNLFRAQALRLTGGNSWRMAHNPPVPARLHIMDRLGVLALDENHFFGGHTSPYGVYDPEPVGQSQRDMAALVQRDRSHPSVWVWNFCNEVNCVNESATAGMRNITDTFDGTRPVTMNHIVTADTLRLLDVQGMSHRAGAHMDSWHAQFPHTPMFSSEAVICESERGVDRDFCPDPNPRAQECWYNSEVANCTSVQVAYSDSRAFNGGTYTWSGFDYTGDTGGGLGSSATGLVGDRAGFEKPIRWWMRSWWLSNISAKDAGRPALWPEARLQDGEHTVFVADHWTPPPPGSHSNTRSVHVYSNAPMVRVWVNGKRAAQAAIPYFGFAAFESLTFEPGNLTAEALDATGARTATHTRLTGGAAVGIRLSLDAPSPDTGTGTALVADGEDVAMVRAQLVDHAGNPVDPQDPSAGANITFSVVSGGGRILGTHNGSPYITVDSSDATCAAHHGLARAFVQSTEVRVGTAADRQLLRDIHTDMGRDGTSKAVDGGGAPVPAIVVQAKAPGLATASITIAMSADPMQLPLAVAAASTSS